MIRMRKKAHLKKMKPQKLMTARINQEAAEAKKALPNQSFSLLAQIS